MEEEDLFCVVYPSKKKMRMMKNKLRKRKTNKPNNNYMKTLEPPPLQNVVVFDTWKVKLPRKKKNKKLSKIRGPCSSATRSLNNEKQEVCCVL